MATVSQLGYEVERRRKLAAMLQNQSEGTITSPMAGLANVLNKGMAGWQTGKADAAEKQKATMQQKALASALDPSRKRSELPQILANGGYEDAALKMATEKPEPLDVEKMAQEAVFKSSSGQPLTPQETAAVDAYNKLKGIEQVPDKEGMLYPKYRPLEVGGAGAQANLGQGNIDLNKRPIVNNPDGSYSTVKSMSFNEDGKEILIPMVSDDGRMMDEREAIQQYHNTGKNLGKFASVDEANAYAQNLHKQQEKQYQPGQIQQAQQAFGGPQGILPPPAVVGNAGQPMPQGTPQPGYQPGAPGEPAFRPTPNANAAFNAELAKTAGETAANGGVPKMTETQSAAASRSELMGNGLRGMTDALASGNVSGFNMALADTAQKGGPLGEFAGNQIRSPDEQKFAASKSAALESLASAVTGAGVTNDQFGRFSNMLPTGSEAPEVQKFKMANAYEFLLTQTKIAGPIAEEMRGEIMRLKSEQAAPAPAAGATPYGTMNDDELMKVIMGAGQ